MPHVLVRGIVVVTMVTALLSGLIGPAVDASRSPVALAATGTSVPAQSLTEQESTGEARPIPVTEHAPWDGQAGVGEVADPFLRQLVVDNAELAEDQEVRDAAAAALTGGPDAIMDFLYVGMDEALAAAEQRKRVTAARDLAAVQALRGTGGPTFRAEVDRVLAGTAEDRAAFLAYGGELARLRDEQLTQAATARSDQLRARLTVLIGSAGPTVRAEAQRALDGGDAAIATFIASGYLTAARADAAAREAEIAAAEERARAGEALTDLAQRAARASTARANLLVANGNGLRALRQAANAMIGASNEARASHQMLAAGGAPAAGAFDPMRAEIVRQLGYAEQAATQAQQAAAAATVEANILVETGLTYGAEWAVLANGAADSTRAAVGAIRTALSSVDAAVATAAARNDQARAEARALEATRWREHAEQHAAAAASLARATDAQANAAVDAAARTRQARLDAEAAERDARAAAQRTRDARIEAENQQRIAADARAVAERERATAASLQQVADREAQVARDARSAAERHAQLAAAADRSARQNEAGSAAAEQRAIAEEGRAATARDQAVAAERALDVARAKAEALEAAAAAARGGAAAQDAQAAAVRARADANTAATAAAGAREAAGVATGAAARSRAAATEANWAAARARAAAAEADAAAQASDAAADRAESEAGTATAAARRADARASDATASQVRAAANAALADQLAARAAGEATSALRAALYTRQEADAAAAEAVSAAAQAQAAVRAATAARTSARGIADPANNAIQAVAPFTGADIGADFITEVARMAGQVGEQQAQAAGAAANEAVIASQQATDAANRAAAQVKPAYEAAARAAESAAAAAQSSARAARAAADAAVDGAAARTADAGAAEAAAQARSDAAGARQAADLARQDAAIAGRSAEAATADARAATAAAEGAERDAAAANAAAVSAEQSAVSARAAADRAEQHAAGAAAAAVNASNSAIEAQQAADRAEAEARRLEAEKRRQEAEASLGTGGSGGIPPQQLTLSEEELLVSMGGEELLQEFRDASSSAARDVLDFIRENGADILMEVIGIADLRRCFGEGNVEACIWTVVNAVSLVLIVVKLPAIAAAIIRIVPGVSRFLDEVDAARRLSGELREGLVEAAIACRRASKSGAAALTLMTGGPECLKWGNPKSQPTYGHTFLKHGAGPKKTRSLTDMARSTGKPEGQWLDDQSAADLIARYDPANGVQTIEIPAGLGHVIKPDGTIVAATKAILVPNRTGGFRSAYPVLG